MGIRSSSITIVTESLVATRQFYERHFQAQRLFGCGWYVVLRLSGPAAQEISLMRPQQGMEPFRGGAYVNLEVEDVDQLYANLTCAGLEAVNPLDDHPWGDRGFGLEDPSGAIVYCYQRIEPADEFKAYFIKAN